MEIALIAFVVVMVVVVALVMTAAGKTAGRDVKQQHEAVSDHSHSLRYVVPPGQDAAMVVVRLREAGFPAVSETAEEGHVVAVAVEPDAEHREEVRSVLSSADRLNTAGDRFDVPQVRFADER